MTENEIQQVWNKGAIPVPQEATKWRKDTCGAWIARDQYGNRNSDYGWEIDHINPNGGDHISNLQPLHWKNNASKGDGKQVCVVVSAGNQNYDMSLASR